MAVNVEETLRFQPKENYLRWIVRAADIKATPVPGGCPVDSWRRKNISPETRLICAQGSTEVDEWPKPVKQTVAAAYGYKLPM